jgi:hypothetical protein
VQAHIESEASFVRGERLTGGGDGGAVGVGIVEAIITHPIIVDLDLTTFGTDHAAAVSAVVLSSVESMELLVAG